MNVNVGLRHARAVSSPQCCFPCTSQLGGSAEECQLWDECAGEIISGLLFADNTALLVSDESGIKKSLEVLAQSCKDCMGGEDECKQVRNHAYEAETSA